MHKRKRRVVGLKWQLHHCASLQNKHDITLYEGALIRLQHGKLLLLQADQVRAMSDGTGILVSLQCPMQKFLHIDRQAFDQAEPAGKGRGHSSNQERCLVWHGQWSGEKAYDLCKTLQGEMQSFMTITAATAFLDAVFQVYLNRLFPTQQKQLIALPAFIVLPATTRSKVTYYAGYARIKVETCELRKQ